jgi:hypothetical protein
MTGNYRINRIDSGVSMSTQSQSLGKLSPTAESQLVENGNTFAPRSLKASLYSSTSPQKAAAKLIKIELLVVITKISSNIR